ncbi:Membrane associated protein-like protein [Lotmaria passim]
MWGFLSDVRESVRQVMAPPPSSTGNTAATASHSSGIEERVSGLTTELFRLWNKVNRTASQMLRETLDGAMPLKEETMPPLFALSDEQRAALSTEELTKLLVDGVTQTTSRAHDALDEAGFLLSLSIEEQIAHTNDYVACYEWWDRTVNRRLITCQEIMQSRFGLATDATAQQRAVVERVAGQMDAIRRESTQPMAAIAARGRLLKDERYDLLRSLPASFPAEAETHATAADDALAPAAPATTVFDSMPHVNASQSPGLAPKPYVPQFKPFLTDPVAHSSSHSNYSAEEPVTHAPPKTQPAESTVKAEEPQSVHLQRHVKERVRLEREAAEEQARLEREAEAERLAQEAEERLRLEREAAEEQARLEREAEAERLAQEAEERLRLEREAAEEQARLEREAAEEQARLEREAEAERLAQEAEERLRLEREAAEEQARLEREAEAERVGREVAEEEKIKLEIARAAAATRANNAAFREEERRRVTAMEAAREGISALESEEASARAKLSRSAQEVSTTLVSQMIMGAQMIEMQATATAAPTTVRFGAPEMAHVNAGNNGWDDDDDDGFEEVDMTPATLRRSAAATTAQSSVWANSRNSNAGAASLSANAARTSMPSLTRDPHSANKKTPPSTPLASRGATAVPAATPTPVRRPGGMSLRKKSPPVRLTPTGAMGTSVAALGGVTPLSCVRPSASPASAGSSSAVKPLCLGTLTSPATASKLPGHQVRMDDDDKWDDDW